MPPIEYRYNGGGHLTDTIWYRYLYYSFGLLKKKKTDKTLAAAIYKTILTVKLINLKKKNCVIETYVYIVLIPIIHWTGPT